MPERCDVCGKELWTGLFGGNVGGRCRICRRLLCTECMREGLCPFCWEKSTGKKYSKSGGCFITEACVEAAGLPDDCMELQTLRDFRDNYLQKSVEGRRMIREYYEIAPIIVEEIRRRSNCDEIFSEIFEEIKGIVLQIRLGNSRKAITSYKAMVSRLKKEYVHNAFPPVNKDR